MSNIIQFPSHIIEKERQLAELEHTLVLQEQMLRANLSAVKQQKRSLALQNIISFVLGIVSAFLLLAFTSMG
jgi:uncharacterized protein (DUF3084 family)